MAGHSHEPRFPNNLSLKSCKRQGACVNMCVVFTFVFICVLVFSSFVCVFIWARPRPTLFSRLGSCLPLFVCFPMHSALLFDQDFRRQIQLLNKYKYISEQIQIHIQKKYKHVCLCLCVFLYALCSAARLRFQKTNTHFKQIQIYIGSKYKSIFKRNTNTSASVCVFSYMHSALLLDQDSLSVHTIALTSSLLCSTEHFESMSK